MKVSASLPSGVAALLFDGAKRHRQLEAAMVEQLEASSFSEVILPVVDYLRPYERLLSEESRGELYRFVDRDGELLALRADFTPMLARLLAPRLPSLELPLRLFYRGDVLRHQEEKAGRQREFFQLGAEVLGVAGEAGEREVLTTFLRLLASGERRRLVVVLGLAGALDERLLASQRAGEAAGAIDLATLIEAVSRRERRLARQADSALLDIVEHGEPADAMTLGEVAGGRLVRLRALRDDLQAEFPAIELRIDLAEFADQVLAPELHAHVGARAYYDGLVFRAFAGAAAEPVGGGGRYDRLFESLGARVSAAGFAFSLDRLLAWNEHAEADR